MQEGSQLRNSDMDTPDCDISEDWNPTPVISSFQFTFTQDGNTLGTTKEFETITIKTEYQIPGEYPFFVIETEGWSVDSVKDLETLFKNFLHVVKHAMGEDKI